MRSLFNCAVPIIAVSDALRAEAFYCDVLGFRIESVHRPDPSKTDPCYMCIAREEVALHLQSFKPERAGSSEAYIFVMDVDELYAEFSAKGASFQLPPTNQTWGTREMGVRDPDGNVVIFGVQLALLDG